jgi:hypothetical protein
MTETKKIDKLLADHQELHSNFQIENFIIGSQGDQWAQYKQCLREIKVRRDTLKDDYGKIAALSHARKKNNFALTKKQKAKRAAIVRQVNALMGTISERERELKRFVVMATGLKKQIGEITDEKREQLEAQSWAAKGRKLAAIDLMAYGRIQTQTLEFIFSLPAPGTKKLLSEFCIKAPPMLIDESCKKMK